MPNTRFLPILRTPVWLHSSDAASFLFYDTVQKTFVVLSSTELYAILKNNPSAIYREYYFAGTQYSLTQFQWSNPFYPPAELSPDYFKTKAFSICLEAQTSVQQGVNALRLAGVALEYVVSFSEGIVVTKVQTEQPQAVLTLPYGIAVLNLRSNLQINADTLVLPSSIQDIASLARIRGYIKNIIIPNADFLLTTETANDLLETDMNLQFPQGIGTLSIDASITTGVVDLTQSKALIIRCMSKSSTKPKACIPHIKLPNVIYGAVFASDERLLVFLQEYCKYWGTTLTVLRWNEKEVLQVSETKVSKFDYEHIKANIGN